MTANSTVKNKSGNLGSVISGGGILSLPKYDPLQGAAQGLVVYLANHLAHELTPEQRRARLKANIEKDGILTLKEANKWYHRGNGGDIDVDASKIDFSKVDRKWLFNANHDPVEINLEFTNIGGQDGMVYGKLALTLRADGFIDIAPNTYDFDFPKGSWTNEVKSFIRNVGTIGGWINSKLNPSAYMLLNPKIGSPTILPMIGKPFTVNFYGQPNIN